MSYLPKRTLARAIANVTLAACAVGTASAASIKAELSKVGGNTWDVAFTVSADPLQTVEAFSIYFDWTKVSNLLVWASPVDWDSLAIQADSALSSDGYLDALALADGITDPKALGGFIARFDWADAAGPTSFHYTINDAVTFDALESGEILVAGSIPEPLSAWLLGIGLAALVAPRIQRQAKGGPGQMGSKRSPLQQDV